MTSFAVQFIALFTIIRTDRNMLLACYSHKHISYRIRTIIRKAIPSKMNVCTAVCQALESATQIAMFVQLCVKPKSIAFLIIVRMR
ncbi:hypothetical protein [Wolbachia endosymbiont (group A) of Scambus nigricans]|uniref:hypothetical protein n=1 Tax=Wolbachia endosymbiont (group A) of Scambus nigricans TaxID=2954055 RepID=UPI002230BDC7|nr:hypothetical protein [Wolbachia endosymbiont (group A) of Scambus nigricans]